MGSWFPKMPASPQMSSKSDTSVQAHTHERVLCFPASINSCWHSGPMSWDTIRSGKSIRHIEGLTVTSQPPTPSPPPRPLGNGHSGGWAVCAALEHCGQPLGHILCGHHLQQDKMCLKYTFIVSWLPNDSHAKQARS